MPVVRPESQPEVAGDGAVAVVAVLDLQRHPPRPGRVRAQGGRQGELEPHDGARGGAGWQAGVGVVVGVAGAALLVLLMPSLWSALGLI